MADITMCNGRDCPLSYKCYRHNAKADSYWQSYFVEAPYKEGKCEEFWEQKEKINEYFNKKGLSI